MSLAQSIERKPSKRGPLSVLRHLYHLTSQRVRQQTKSYALGFFWWFLDPVINTAILYVVVSVVLQRRTPDLALLLLVGTTTFRYLQNAISGANNSLNQAMSLSSRLYVPKYQFVVRDVAAQTVQFVIGLAFITTLIFLFSNPHLKPLALAYVVLVAVTFSMAAASVFALIGAVFADIRVLLGYLFRALFFLSGIFFTIDQVPEEYRTAFLSNPFALLIQEFRIAIIYDQPLDYGLLTILLGVSLVVGALGFFFLFKLDRVLPKYAS